VPVDAPAAAEAESDAKGSMGEAALAGA
jgi:hypothetical protein